MAERATEKFYQLVKEREMTILDGEYKDKNSPFILQDKDGYKYRTNYGNFKYGNPAIVRETNPFSIHNIKNYIKLNNINVELLSEEYINKKTDLKWKCECGNIFYKNFHQIKLRNIFCEDCGKAYSSLEKKTILALDAFGVNYETEKSFDNCVDKIKLKFDFYIHLDKIDIAIECDGEQHYRPVGKWGGVDGFHEIQRRDRIKNKFCVDNNIPLLRIKYDKFDTSEYIILIKNFINKYSW